MQSRDVDTLTLQTPHATVHSSDDADPWLAWHSMHRSIMWLRQIAQLSTTMSVQVGETRGRTECSKTMKIVQLGEDHKEVHVLDSTVHIAQDTFRKHSRMQTHPLHTQSHSHIHMLTHHTHSRTHAQLIVNMPLSLPASNESVRTTVKHGWCVSRGRAERARSHPTPTTQQHSTS